jgi:hypothetical protein
MAHYEKTLISIGIALLIGCSQTAPKLRDGELMSCFRHRYCLWSNLKNHDKSACSKADRDCSIDLQRKALKDDMKYCDESLPKDMTVRECRLYLKQR